MFSFLSLLLKPSWSNFHPLVRISGALPTVSFSANLFPVQVPAAAAAAAAKLSANDIGSPPLVTSCMPDMILHECVELMEMCLLWIAWWEEGAESVCTETQVIPIWLHDRIGFTGSWE